MITLTEQDAAWLREQTRHPGGCEHEDCQRIEKLLTEGSADATCACNTERQVDAAVPSPELAIGRHQRGDTRVCQR